MNPTIRLTYYSKAVREMTLADMKQILTVARQNNTGKGICGMLCYDNQYFMQVLEGPREEVSDLFLLIADDPRHDEVVLMNFEYIDATVFQDWKMGYASSSPAFEKALAKLNMPQFDPSLLSPKNALIILKHLSAHQQQLESVD